MNFNKFQKISISFFLTVFLFSIFYFLFFDIVFAADKQNSINIACDEYKYPWCEDAKKGIAPLVNRFYIIALGLAGASALGVLIYGAILWTLSGVVTSKQDAKERISGALWGLALLLSAYLILHTINPRLTILENPMKDASKVIQPAVPYWKAEQIKEGTSAYRAALEGNTDAGNRYILSEYSKTGIVAMNAITGKENPRNPRITINKTERQGTSLKGLQPATIEGIQKIFDGCGQCSFMITGGTEKGHAAGEKSHETGYKIDISYNLDPGGKLRNYIHNQIGKTNVGPNENLNKNFVGKDGNVYRLEKNWPSGVGHHWDICFGCAKR